MKKIFGSTGWMGRHKAVGIIAIICIVAGIAALFFWFQSANQKSRMPAKKVNMVTLEKMELTSSVSATGTIESAKSKKVSANLSNITIAKVKVKEGDSVKKGQTLVTFDKSDLQNTLASAKENLSDAKAQANNEISNAQRQLNQARAAYHSQKKKMAKSAAAAKASYQAAEKALSRLKKKAAKAAGAEKNQQQSELTKAQEEVKQAKSSYEQAVNEQENSNQQNKNNIENAEASVSSARTNTNKAVREAEKNVKDAAEGLAKCSVTAPMSGIVTAVGVEEGDNYNGGDMFEISNCTNLRVSTTVSEYDIAKVKKGQRVVILTDATDEDEFEGEITYVALTMGSSSLSAGSGNESGASMGNASDSDSSGYEVRIRIKKKDERLRVGMTAKCSIILEEADDVYAVPYDAIHQAENGDSVLYVIDAEGNQKEVSVTKGMESDYYVEVSGELSEGMQVVLPSDVTTDETSSDSKDGSGSELPGMMRGMNKGNGSSDDMPGPPPDGAGDMPNHTRGGGMPPGGGPGM